MSRAGPRHASSQWETSLQSNAVSRWLGAHLESALYEGLCARSIYQVQGQVIASHRHLKFRTAFLLIPLTWFIQMKQTLDNVLQLNRSTPLWYFVLALKLLSGDRSQIVHNASNYLLNTKFPIYFWDILGEVLKKDPSLYTLLCILNFRRCIFILSLHVRVALKSQYLLWLGPSHFQPIKIFYIYYRQCLYTTSFKLALTSISLYQGRF